MSLNFSSGTPIAVMNKKTIYVSDDKHGEQEIHSKEALLPAIQKNTERTICYISGASGSGKSYCVKRYVEQYRKVYPTRPVYLFSSLSDDPTLDKLKYIKRIKIKDPKFLTIELSAEDFKESLILFDDTDCISNKKIALKLTNLLDSIIDVGRHFKVSLIYTSHILCNGIRTKHILGEAHQYTIFPLTASKKHLHYLLETYLGFSKAEIEKLIALDGRPRTIVKSYPIVVYSDNLIYIK
jgi:predicted AAA+ superfamily ATPase